MRSSPRRAAPPSGTLRERRARQRRAYGITAIILLTLLIAGLFYAAWRPGFRIQSVHAEGPGAPAAQQIAETDLQGAYLHILPRNSVFFYPEARIRAAILDAVPEAAAVSMQRTTFSSIRVVTIPREESFIWCGTGIDMPNPDGACYQADIQGYLFAQDGSTSGTAIQSEASTTASSTEETAVASTSAAAVAASGQGDAVRVFDALRSPLADGQSPVRDTVAQADKIADALKFADAMRSLGAPVSALAIRGDEADLWLQGPTRITYVLGQEQAAANVAASALPTLNLKDGSVEYVDLRFAGKAYVKKYGSGS